MRAFLFDVETTGLIQNRTLPPDKLPEVIEFYGCIADLESAEIKRDFETFVRPKLVSEIPDKITKITGINMQMLASAPAFSEVADEIADLVKDASMAIGHNVSFDCEMLDIEFSRLGKLIAWPQKLCTVEQTIHVRGHRLNLGALHEFLFGVGFTGAHRAKEDVHALLRCAQEMLRRDWI